MLMPVFMTAPFLLQRTGRDQTDSRDRPFAVIDHTGVLFEPLRSAAEERNAAAQGSSRPLPRFLA